MAEIKNFESIGISLASPEKILEWSHGEVTKPETINYRTLKPERDGLFCERIFGPTKDWECHCGKYKKIRYRGIVCDRCGVEVTRAKVRRERMGHIKLAAPCSHIWFFKGTPSRLGLVLDMKPRDLEKILYFAAYIVLDPGQTDFAYKELITEGQYREAEAKYGRNSFDARMGAEAIKIILDDLDIDQMAVDLREEMRQSKGQKKIRLIRRLEVIEGFAKSGNKPSWMILDVLPVLPPELRPMVQLDGGRFATSDLNDLYRRVINRNNRLSKLMHLGAPEIIIRNEKRMLQESVDALIDNGRRGRAVTGAGNRRLKSLSDLLKGKQGRFRQNLLGKRVDYSGRSVIVIGPNLQMHQCGLPQEMALELFKPFVMHELEKRELAHNMKSAKRMVERADDAVWEILEDVIKDHPVLLNRAPTLHRLGIQAFEPVLVQGRAIKLHPLACTAFNADFDGDQMAVHLPLSAEAQAEARFLMLASGNLLKPQDGKPVTVPTQDMVLGIYYLSMVDDGCKGEGGIYMDLDEAIMAYDKGDLELHAKIKVRLQGEKDGKPFQQTVSSSLGRFILNSVIPQDLGYVDRTIPGNELALEIDFLCGKKQLGQIIARAINKHGLNESAHMLDRIKSLGYHYSTLGGISIGIFDMVVPEVKEAMIKDAEAKVEKINRQYERGILNDDGRSRAVIDVWRRTTDDITEALKANLGPYNPVFMMSNSGARGNINQIKQLAGMRGNMVDTSGRTLEIPIKSNLREGMAVYEFFISSHGARKSLSDTALKTADSGYLTRRLVDVAQDVIVTEEDCGTREFIEVGPVAVGSGANRKVIERLADRISGRYAARDIIHPETGEVLVPENTMISADQAELIEELNFKKIPIRSNLTCESRHGVCAHCYGKNLATGGHTVVGEAVGIMSAQSIGEPGTQLTLRTFHTGGVASFDDITQGLPRIEELFEARKPKGQAIIADISGTVHLQEDENRKRQVTVTNEEGDVQKLNIPINTTLLVEDGEFVEAGDLITDGSVNPHDIMTIKGPRGVATYIINEVLKVYKNNGVDINDKHIEIIVRQMLRMVKVEDPGDTDFLTGTNVDHFVFKDTNERMIAEGKEPAVGERALMGITKAALATESFLSAASFQEQTRVLTDAALKGKVDKLKGLKENVIIGKLIPAGTGMPDYRNITAVPDVPENHDLLQMAAN